MKTTGINYDKAFQLFVNKDDFRESFHQPFKFKDKYFASDGHGLMFLPTKEVKLPYPETEKTSFAAVIEKEETLNQEINISELEGKLIPVMIDEITEEKIEQKCTECDGDGEVEYEWKTHNLKGDCPVCDGSGNLNRIESKFTGEKIAAPNKQYKLFGVIFSYYQLSRLVTACKLIGGEKIIKRFGETNSGNLFRCDNAGFLIMPMINCGDGPIDFIIIS